MQLLVQHEGLVDIKKEDGFSALHLAALNNHKTVAEIMIKDVSTTRDVISHVISKLGDRPKIILYVWCQVKLFQPTRTVV